MEVDVLIVGAGPSGLSAAIRLMQLAERAGTELSVCVIEKGSEVGAHIMSGAVMEPRAMDELFPDWKDLGAPLNVPVTKEKFMFLTAVNSVPLPAFLLPKVSFCNIRCFLFSFVISIPCRYCSARSSAVL